MLFIIASVLMVSIGSKSNVKKAESGNAELVSENEALLNWSIVFALLCGLILSLQLLATKHILS